MRSRILVSILTVIALVSGAAIAGAARTGGLDREFLRPHHGVTEGFVPAVAVSRSGRYFVLMRAPSVSQRVAAAPRTMGRAAQRATSRSALRSQRGAIRAVKDAGGTIVFRYSVLLNGFSAQMSQADATRLLRRGDVASVQPVAVVQRTNDQSVPFIGAKKVWQELGIRGQGMRVAVVDTGIDYTHADFGGPGTVAAYESNDPNFIEPGTFPTDKVIGGFDFVGSNYDVLDEDTSNDIPRPDADPLDRDGHGTHTAGTCCGSGVPGIVGKGVAPAARLYAIKVWDVGNSSADVLVAGYEFAVDPNQDGSTTDHADVLSFSGGVDYGTSNSAEALAAERVVGIGTVFVASAGNSGNQAAGGSAYILGTPAAAPGVIAVAASIDQFVLNTITVNAPAVTLPDGGFMAVQDWGAPIP
ncbi:MAG: S8 family serine peptidase, partial [Actinomycetota bacterium]